MGRENSCACGLDPGREKFGLAIAAGGALIFSAIIPTERLNEALVLLVSGQWSGLTQWEKERPIPLAELDEAGSRVKSCPVYLGDGTGSGTFQRELREAGIQYELTDETDTTLAGRTLYWRLHPPRGIWRLIPLSLRVPPRPLDDMAAWAILQRGDAPKIEKVLRSGQ